MDFAHGVCLAFPAPWEEFVDWLDENVRPCLEAVQRRGLHALSDYYYRGVVQYFVWYRVEGTSDGCGSDRGDDR